MTMATTVLTTVCASAGRARAGEFHRNRAADHHQRDGVGALQRVAASQLSWPAQSELDRLFRAPPSGSSAHRQPQVSGSSAHRKPQVSGCSAHRQPQVSGDSAHRQPQVSGCSAQRKPQVRGNTQITRRSCQVSLTASLRLAHIECNKLNHQIK